MSAATAPSTAAALANTNARRVALYSRVSTEDQTDRGTIRAQRDFLADFARLYGLEVGGEYVDDGFSGTLPLDRRPDGARLLEDARQGRFGTVLVYRLDRLGRSLASLLDANAALEAAGVTIKSATEPFDTSTPIGRFLFQLLGGLAELEKSTISERMVLGRDRVARAGKWTNGPVPFGYDLDADGCLIPSGRVINGLGITEAEVARSVLVRIADGSSTVAEARRLNALGVPTRRRYAGGAEVTVGEDWKPSRVNQMVRNPVYSGTHVLKSKGGAVERVVPALVDRATWERAQIQLTKNRAMSTRNAKHTYLLRGLVRCAGCGARFVGTPNSSKSGWTGNYYRCGSQLAAARPDPADRCRAKALRADWLEDLVWADCRGFVLDPGPVLAEAQAQLRERLSRSAELDGERRTLQAHLAEKEAERERVMTLYRRGRASLADAEAQLDAIQAEASGMRAALDAMRTQEELARAFEAHHVEAAALLARLRDRVAEIDETDDRETKRQVIELLVSDVVVTSVGEGRSKEASVAVTYAFSSRDVVDATTSSRGRTPGRG